MRFTNDLTDAELERLAILSEELGEAVKAIGKIVRHGYESYNPDVPDAASNRQDLEREMGDVLHALDRMVEKEDLSRPAIERQRVEKAKKIKPYLHHQVAR